MSRNINPSHAYALLAGLYLGHFTNFASDIIITALVLYIVSPQIYTEERFERAKNWCWSWFEKKQPVMIEMSELNLTDEQKIKLKLLESIKSDGTFLNQINLKALPPLPQIEILPSTPKYLVNK